MQLRSLLVQCREPLKARMLDKLDAGKRWSYVSVPDGVDGGKMLAAMRDFIEYKLDEFLNLCADVLPEFSLEDSETMTTGKLTARAAKFIQLFDYLEANGFPGPRMFGRPLYFWSGEAARNGAPKNALELSDNRIPAVAVMFDVCQCIVELYGKYDEHLCLLCTSISRYYAMHASGVVNVYLSSDKESEAAGFSVGNNFWNGELAVLQSLKKRGIVNDIHIHLYDHQMKQWRQPVSLFSEAGNAIEIRRRCFNEWHDKPQHRERFRSCGMAKEVWSKTSPRPSITVGDMHKYVRRWHAYANSRLFARNANDRQISQSDQDAGMYRLLPN